MNAGAADDGGATWFIDRNLGHALATALRARGERVIHHDERFLSNAPDTEWLPVVGENGWLLLTKDKAIRKRIHEREALRVAKVGAFFLSAGNLRGREQVERFIKNLERMRACAATTKRPFSAIVHAGRVEVIDAAGMRIGERR